VAVAHGSADPRASATIAELSAVARERSPGLDLRTAFLGHAPPSLPQVLGTIEADREVTVLPLLLTAAYHSKADIPRMLARIPRPRVSYGATLGPHPLLLDALDRRLAEADPGAHRDPSRTAVVLAAAGSSDPGRTPRSPGWRHSGRPGRGGSPSGRPTPRPPNPLPRPL
jgi:sirohydrochlorin ferrochelatase